MTLYLQMDGVDDYIKTPSMAFDEIEMVIKQRLGSNRYYLDARTGFANAFLYRDSSGKETTSGSGPFANGLYWDGVKKTNVSSFIPVDTKGTLRLVGSTSGTDDVNFFSNNTNGSCGAGDIFSIKLLLGGVVQAYYNMSTGTVQDQSGNGRHATLTGGTWLDDGAGGGTNATVNAITANTTASSVNPVVSAQQQVSVSSVVANAIAEALAPSVGSNTNITVSAVIANATASANAPNVEAVRNISITHIIPNTVATAAVPTIRIVEPVIFRVGVPVVSNLEKELLLRSELENTMPVSTNIISAITTNHSV